MPGSSSPGTMTPCIVMYFLAPDFFLFPNLKNKLVKRWDLPLRTTTPSPTRSALIATVSVSELVELMSKNHKKNDFFNIKFLCVLRDSHLILNTPHIISVKNLRCCLFWSMEPLKKKMNATVKSSGCLKIGFGP